MSYSKSDKQYYDTHETMTQILPTPIMKYFDKNWNPIKDEWVEVFINDNF